MAAVKLDNAGLAKLKTIEEALATIQTIHGHVERMAIDVKNERGAGVIRQQVKRLAVPMQGRLKGQFGMIADQVAAMILATGRGGPDQQKVRVMREFVAQIRQALEIAASKVREQHTVSEDEAAPS